MPTGIDHIVIAVNDLDQTVKDYTAAGFTVTPGGEHHHGISHNALVVFADGAYFELIAFRNNGEGHGTHWPATLRAGEGVVDYAVRTDDLTQEVRALRQAGLTYSDPKDGGRLRPDGQRVDWQTSRFGWDREIPSRLPFFCHDLTARPLRVPEGEETVHANGVTGIAGVSIVVHDLGAAIRDYAALTGDPGSAVERTLDDVAGAHRFPLGGAWVEVVEPSARQSDLRTYLEQRGELPYEIALAAPDGRGELLPDSLTHGVPLLVVDEAGVAGD